MNNNSVNICTRCGTPNSTSARFCYQCGGQLKIPQEPVVCPKCNTVNNGLANFCRNCGNSIKLGSLTKNCPRCGKTVPADSSQCACGYSFATVNAVVGASEQAVDVKTGNTVVMPIKASRAGGKALGVISLLIVLAVMALYALGQFWTPSFLDTLQVLNGVSYNGYELIYIIATGAINGTLWANTSVALWMVYGMMTIFALCIAVQLVASFVRMFVGGRPKKANVLYLMLFILFSLAVALIKVNEIPAVMNIEFLQFLAIFALPDGHAVGTLLYALPGYYFLFFIISLIAKRKKAVSA